MTERTHRGCRPTENRALYSKLRPCTHGHAAAFTCEVSEYLRYDHRDAVFHAALEDRHRGAVKTERGPLRGSVGGKATPSYLYAQAQAAHRLSAKRNSSVL